MTTLFTKLEELGVQLYERYLPTAFDNALTMLEKVNMMREYCNQMGITINALIDAFNEWETTGIPNAILNQFNTYLNDGTFETLINETILQEINEKVDLVFDYDAYPQAARPPKQGILTNSPKLVLKNADDSFMVIQKTNKGYLRYGFDTLNGKSKDTSNAGDHWDLVRLKLVRHISDFYLYYDIATPTTGTLGVYTLPQTYMDVEAQLLDIGFRDDAKTFASKSNGEGVGIYSLAAASQVTYSIPITSAKKMNLLFQAPTGGSNDVEILVNGVSVKTFNPRAFVQGSSNGYGIIEFEVPTRRNSSSNMTITINNRAASLIFYPVCLNFVTLKDWNKHYVTHYKAIGSNRNDFINEVGASDYAFMNKDRVLFGSYHGGEERTYGRAMWTPQKQVDVDSYASLTDFVSIPNGEWRILPDFKILQKTSLLGGQAKMVSDFNFNIDGTLEMKFALIESTIEFISTYTALTCCGPTFNYIGYPWLGALPADDGEYYTVPMNEGYIIQYDPQLTGQEIGIRFTKFNEISNVRNHPYVWNSSNYKKFYYGPLVQADQSGGSKLIKNLTFSKGLDFNIR